MRERRDISGVRFGRLLAMTETQSRKYGSVVWLCRCDCGNVIEVPCHSLVSGNTQSCGCLASELTAKRNSETAKHGMTKSRIYSVWRHMHQRCELKSHIHYGQYGGRGISVCHEWDEFLPFYEWAMVNGYSDELSIDRIDVDGDYCPGNCRFVTSVEQANNKRNNVFITYNGISKTYAEWERTTGIGRKTIQYRINHGWPVDRALTIIPQHKSLHKEAL